MTTKMLGSFFNGVLAYAAQGSSVLSSDLQQQCVPFGWTAINAKREPLLWSSLVISQGKPIEMAERISLELNLSVLFKGTPSCKLQCLAEKMHQSVALFSLIDLRSSDAGSDKHTLFSEECNPEDETEASSKQFISTSIFFLVLHSESCVAEQLLLAQALGKFTCAVLSSRA